MQITPELHVKSDYSVHTVQEQKKKTREFYKAKVVWGKEHKHPQDATRMALTTCVETVTLGLIPDIAFVLRSDVGLSYRKQARRNAGQSHK